MAKTNLQDFSVVDFPPAIGPGFVYVLSWLSGDEEIPFYVGETQSIWGRLNDYYWAQFQASTDFRVGEAVKHLHLKSLRIVARYRSSEDRRKEERAIIDQIHADGRRLLNDVRGYDYRTAREDEERTRVRQCIDSLVDASLKPDAADSN
jgi:hypothetical protein